MTNYQMRHSHTPGPWHVQTPPINREPGANNHGYYILYATQGSNDNRTRDIAYSLITSEYEDAGSGSDIRECEANAHLIASSPELLSLAKAIHAACVDRISVLKKELKAEWCDAEDIEDQIEHFIDEQIWNWNALLNKCNEVIAKTQSTPRKSRLARKGRLHGDACKFHPLKGGR